MAQNDRLCEVVGNITKFLILIHENFDILLYLIVKLERYLKVKKRAVLL